MVMTKTRPASKARGKALDGILPDIPDGLAASLVRALLSPVPRPLLKIDAELVMFSGQYLLHFKDEHTGAEQYKFVTPGSLRAAFAGEAMDSGWLSPGVVRWGESTRGQYQVLWIPPSVRVVAIDVEEEVVDVEEGEAKKGMRVEVEQLSVPLPGMVMVGVGSQYHIWAVAVDTFSPDAKAYYPPLPNIFEPGHICWGANRPPAVSEQRGIERAFELFLSAPFNDHLAGHRAQSFPNDARGLLHKLAKKKPKAFPVGELFPFAKGYQGQTTIGHVVDSVVKG